MFLLIPIKYRLSRNADVYLMTFPFSKISGTLKILATATDGTYYGRVLTMSNATLTSGKVVARSVSMNIPKNFGVAGAWSSSRTNCATMNEALKYIHTTFYYDVKQTWFLGGTDIDHLSGGGTWFKKSATTDGTSVGSIQTNYTATDSWYNYTGDKSLYFFMPDGNSWTTTQHPSNSAWGILLNSNSSTKKVQCWGDPKSNSNNYTWLRD